MFFEICVLSACTNADSKCVREALVRIKDGDHAFVALDMTRI